MIEPNMATMLGFLTTDAQVPPALLRRALAESARDTFNAITVDGECSTNDSLFALASGASGVVIDEETVPGAARGAARRLARAGPRHRPRRRGRHQADRRVTSATRAATTTRGRWRARSPTRRWSRPRCTAPTRTGAASSPRPAARACTSTSSAPPCTSAASCCSRTACRTTMPRREPAEHLKGTDVQHRRQPRHRRAAAPPRSGPAI